MVSDDELARHVEAFERTGTRADLEERVDRIERHARTVHDELLHRVEATRANAATRDDLADIVDRLDTIESRLDALETELASTTETETDD
jgi:tetrahydromethanopterin S-methyltransferase subunit G